MLQHLFFTKISEELYCLHHFELDWIELKKKRERERQKNNYNSLAFSSLPSPIFTVQWDEAFCRNHYDSWWTLKLSWVKPCLSCDCLIPHTDRRSWSLSWLGESHIRDRWPVHWFFSSKTCGSWETWHKLHLLEQSMWSLHTEDTPTTRLEPKKLSLANVSLGRRHTLEFREKKEPTTLAPATSMPWGSPSDDHGTS